MGVGIHGGTMQGAVTPMRNNCGTALCWDLAEEEYEQAKVFWDEWICQDCNGGKPFSLKAWMRSNAKVNNAVTTEKEHGIRKDTAAEH